MKHPEDNRTYLAKRRAIAMAMFIRRDCDNVLVAFLKATPKAYRAAAMKLWAKSPYEAAAKRIVCVAEQLNPAEFAARCDAANVGEPK